MSTTISSPARIGPSPALWQSQAWSPAAAIVCSATAPSARVAWLISSRSRSEVRILPPVDELPALDFRFGQGLRHHAEAGRARAVALAQGLDFGGGLQFALGKKRALRCRRDLHSGVPQLEGEPGREPRPDPELADPVNLRQMLHQLAVIRLPSGRQPEAPCRPGPDVGQQQQLVEVGFLRHPPAYSIGATTPIFFFPAEKAR